MCWDNKGKSDPRDSDIEWDWCNEEDLIDEFGISEEELDQGKQAFNEDSAER